MEKILTTIFPQMKMSEMVIENPDLVNILTRWNIPFGFGDQTVESIAKQYKIHLDAFLSSLLICTGKYTREWIVEKEGLKDLLHFLEVSHVYFKEIQIPELKILIKKFAENIPDKHGKILVSFFDGYIEEVNEHFEYEDQTVFPYITSILRDKQENDYKIKEFEKNHSDIEQKLLDLKNILLTYTSGELKSDNRHEIFQKLVVLEKDIDYHNIIENKILIPSIKILEKAIKKAKS